PAPALEPAHDPPVDGVQAYPDIVGETPPVSTPPLLDTSFAEGDEDETVDEDTQQSLFDVSTPAPAAYKLPDRSLLRRSKPGAGPTGEANTRVAEALVQCLANFGVEATVVGMIAGPRVTRYELQLAPGTKVGKVAQLKDDLSYALATT